MIIFAYDFKVIIIEGEIVIELNTKSCKPFSRVDGFKDLISFLK